MQQDRHPHRIAIQAILLAIGLPTIVFLFGTLRTRQLQSTANPRWAQFAKLTGPRVPADAKPRSSQRVSAQTVSIRSEEPSIVATEPPRPIPTGLTGSVSGHHSIEIPVRSVPRPTASEVEDRPPMVVRPIDEEREAELARSALRLEMEVIEIRQRLNQLTHFQQAHQTEDAQRGLQLLEAVRAFREMVANFAMVDEVPAETDSSPETIGADFPVKAPVIRESVAADSVASDPAVVESIVPEPSAKDAVATQPTNTKPIPSPPTAVEQETVESTIPPVSVASTVEPPRPVPVEEPSRLHQEDRSLDLKIDQRSDLGTTDINRKIFLIVPGAAKDSNANLDDRSWERSMPLPTIEVRDLRFPISRRLLARAFYERAVFLFDRGDVAGARQQVEASLRNHKDDLDAIRLRNQIIQGATHRHGR